MGIYMGFQTGFYSGFHNNYYFRRFPAKTGIFQYISIILAKNALFKFRMSFFTRISNETAHQSKKLEKTSRHESQQKYSPY